ncbi:hypothetical protein GM418_19380 [Maribellus comscasis]|uniref:ATP-binding protein n=1 Tax=Maribellus comscasis TaxID=2681766 RepID=A0A6I6K6Z0_9BACT|nr:hypothetical protein [Maribellus comscasis]QGY45754.1 hypothetical protein GM418_19380 [Maribellus comscasis]
MQTKYYSPSINILRDANSHLDYIPTRNGEKAFQKIVSAFEENGRKSFNIIGAYGTGKSAFILALEKVLNKKADYFINPLDGFIDSFEPVFIVGSYSSFKEEFCDTLGIKTNENIFEKLKSVTEKKKKARIGQLIVVDEFGKFLEYAAKESPEEELYFIQQLAEFVNTPDLPILFITTLHQPFEDYALTLSKTQKNEWDKVKGRLTEVSFNEPVEQLLFLASERISAKRYPCHIPIRKQKQLFDAIKKADVFPMRDYFSFEFAQKLFPLDILSASVATVAFQRYGQNERSLFSLLESEDYLGINDFKNGKEYYNVACIYDYLKYNFHSLLNSRYNQDSAHWKSIDEALQRAETIFEKDFVDAAKLIKTIGLISVLGRQGQKVTKSFLTTYASVALNITDATPLIDLLESKQIIRFREYSQRYVLFKGTDFDINLELELAEGQVTKDFSIITQLKQHFNFPIIPAKRIYFDKGTPRYFIYEISESPIQKMPEEQIDGYINLIFTDYLDFEKSLNGTKNNEKPILYGWFYDVNAIKDSLVEIEKIKIVKGKCLDDTIALAELDTYLNDTTDRLNDLFLESFYGEDADVKWFYNGEQITFKNNRDLNSTLLEICNEIYFQTPVLRNELMNRERLSGAISAAKKNLIERLIQSVEIENLAFEENRFPPDKTIYLALLKETGIHQQNSNNVWELGKPTEKSFLPIWNASETFLDDCISAPRKLSEFIEILKSKPFKLKHGFIEFWIPVFLIAKQKQFAFYEQDTFIPALTKDTLEVAMKQPQKYFISTFQLDETRLNIFNRYRYFLNQIEENAPNSDSFIQTIKPFLVFYNRLLPYAQQTKNLSKEALRLKEAISLATNPEKVFFEDIPRALGFTINDLKQDEKLEEFSISLQNATREISAAFPNLVNRIEKSIGKTIREEKVDFPENKLLLQQRFKNLRNEKIDPKLRILAQRINTPLDGRQAWISSAASA